MKRKLLVCLALWALGAILPIKADTVLVSDGTDTNKYVPIYGFYADAFLKCEYVIPATDLANMIGGTITSITWYASSPAAESWTTEGFHVFLTEVSSTTISAFYGPDNATTVYTGTIDGTTATITIEFSTPYVYQGGNLLVGVYNTVKGGSYSNISFYGANVEGASVQGHSTSTFDGVSANQRNFSPKTTLTYTPGEGTFIPRPTEFTASAITSTSATLSWEAGGTETLWTVGYKEETSEEWTEATVSTPSMNLTDLTPGTTYNARVCAVMATDGSTSAWSDLKFSTPFCDVENQGPIYYSLGDTYGDGWNGNTIDVVNSNGTVVGTITLANGASAEGSMALCYGETYSFVWNEVRYGDECSFTITDEEGAVIVEHSAGTAPESGVLATYTMTEISCERPTELTASDVTYYGVTLTWAPGTSKQTQWELAIVDDAEFDPNDADLIQVQGEPTFTTSALPSDNTTYYAYVRGVCDEDEVSNWSDVCEFTTPEQFPRPTDVAVNGITASSAEVSFVTDASAVNLRYRPISLFESFENNIPDSWTLIDNDGDGVNWMVMDPTKFNEGYSAFDGKYVVMSRSWQNNSALTPDNWLITPQVQLGGSLKYWIRDDGQAQYAETYRIYVSVTGTDIEDFTPLTEDMTSPGSTEWTPCEFDLSDYEGRMGYIAFRHYNCTDEDYMWIDAMSINGSTVDWIAVNDIPNPHYASETTPVGFYEMTGLTPDTPYEVAVQSKYGENTSRWTAAQFATPNAASIPTDLNISDETTTSAIAGWTGIQESYNLRYRTQLVHNGFFEDFEGLAADALPTGWTTIDADGDGYNWFSFTSEEPVDNNGNPTAFDYGCATSASYNGNPLTPDNWLITPQIELKGTLSVWLRAQDPEWLGEHFAIYASTTGNTSVDDFTEVLVEETESESQYVEYTADLSRFEGQTGYIAVRHFNCSNEFRLNVDNFYIRYGEETPPGEWFTLTGVTSPYTMTDLLPDTGYEVQVQGVVSPEVDPTVGTTEWTDLVKFTTLDVTKGDLTGDGTIDGSDVSALLEIVLSGGELTPQQIAAGDLTGDGVIDGSDVSALLEIVLSGDGEAH